MSDTYIERDALLFEAGEYPDKGVNVTTADLLRIVENTTETCPLIFAHDMEERLDFGHATGLSVKDGALYGKLHIHQEAMPFVERNGLKSLSVGLNTRDWKLGEVSYTRKPRVANAAMFSVDEDGVALFSIGETTFRHDTRTGQVAMQDMHDMAARAGAVCSKTNARMSSKHEMRAIQSIHDTAVKHGATCENMKEGAPLYGWSEEKPMPETLSLKDKFISLFKKAGVSETEATEALADITFASDDKRPDPELLKKFNDLESKYSAELTTMRNKAIAADAHAWFSTALANKQVIPGEEAIMKAAYVQAAQDDAANPATVTFSIGAETKTSNRLDLIKSLVASRAPHTLFSEMFKEMEPKDLAVFSAQLETRQTGDKKPMTAERRAELLEKVPGGKEILAGK